MKNYAKIGGTLWVFHLSIPHIDTLINPEVSLILRDYCYMSVTFRNIKVISSKHLQPSVNIAPPYLRILLHI